jgi:hypothetical protein
VLIVLEKIVQPDRINRDALVILLMLIQIITLSYFLAFIGTGGLADIGVISDMNYLGFTILALVTLLLIDTIMYGTFLHSPKMLIVSFILKAVALTVFLPVFKYYTYLTPRFYGCWDTSGHYSFSLWVLEHGRLPLDTSLFYSDTYGFHPGTPLIPAFYSVVTGVSLDLSISLMLFVIYVVYAVSLYNIVGHVSLGGSLRTGLNVVLLSILMIVLPLYYPYYTGSSASSIFVALLFYIVIVSILHSRSSTLSFTITYMILYIGLYLTHYSTMIIYSATALSLLGLLFIVSATRGRETKVFTRLIYLTLSTTFLSLILELYVDVVLFKTTLQQAIEDIILRLYVIEVQGYIQPKKYYLPLYLRIWNYFTTYPKEILLLILQVFFTLYTMFSIVLRRRGVEPHIRRIYEYIAYSMLFGSYIPLVVSWGGVGKLVTASARYMVTSQFALVSSFAFILHGDVNSKAFVEKHQRITSVVLAVGIIVLILSNYGLAVLSSPVLYRGREAYLYVANGLISPYIMHAHQYLNSYIEPNSGMRLCCLQPFTSFGVCDLAWNTRYRIIYMEQDLECNPSTILSLLKEYRIGYNCQIVPIPLREGVVPACFKLGDFYMGLGDLVPRSFSKTMMYNNGFYSLHM